MMVPIKRAKIKCLVDSAPIRKRLTSIKIMVKELLRERIRVSETAWLIT